MKLHSPMFERSLRRSVKRIVKGDRELRKESRRYSKRRPNQWIGWLFRLLISLLLALLAWRAFQATHHLAAALMMMNLWMLTTATGFAKSLVNLPFNSNDIVALRILPVEESTIFRWELDKFLKASVFCLSDLMAGYAALGLALHFTVFQWILMSFLIPLNGAFMFALAAFGAARCPRVPYALIFGNLYVLWFLAFITLKFIGKPLLIFLDHTAPIFNLLVPVGWPLSLFHLLVPESGWLWGILVLPVGLIIWSTKNSISILRKNFVYREPLYREAPDLMLDPDSVEMPTADTPLQRPIGKTAIEEGILSGEFLRQKDWNRGWLEKILWRWFSVREKTLAEFAFPQGLQITKPWKIILRNFLFALMLGFCVGFESSILGLWVFGLGFFIVFAHAMGQVLNAGVAFGAFTNAGLQIPMYAAYPISFRELSRTLIKCSAIQMPLFILLTIAAVVMMSHFSGLTFWTSVATGVNASLTFWGVRFFVLAFGFSSGTNDSSKISLRSVALFIFFAFFGLLFLIITVFTGVFVIVGAGSGIVSELQPILWIGCLLAWLVGYTFFRIYGWFYNRNRFDLMRTD